MSLISQRLPQPATVYKSHLNRTPKRGHQALAWFTLGAYTRGALFDWRSVLGCIFALSVGACGGATAGQPCETDAECGPGGVCSVARCVDAGEQGPDTTLATGLQIEPAEVELVSEEGAEVAADFQAVVTYADGREMAVSNAVFTVETGNVGRIDAASGRFTASGLVGGEVNLRAVVRQSNGERLFASAKVRVKLVRSVFGEDVPPDAATRFETLVDDAEAQAQVVYPINGVVMPQNVAPATLQWERTNPGDLLQVTFEKPNATLHAYLVATGSQAWSVDSALWRAFAQTDGEIPATVRLNRSIAGQDSAVRGAPIQLTFARASLNGSIYYWDIVSGRILRIDDNTGQREDFMPSPPLSKDGASCVGCHRVSPSGRYMVGRLGGGMNIGAIFDLTQDLRGALPPTTFPMRRGGVEEGLSPEWKFSTWSPDETRLAVTTYSPNELHHQLAILDPFSGAFVPTQGTLPQNATHPAWSPDGVSIAYIANANDWGNANTTGDLALLEVTGPDAFGATRVVLPGTALAGSRPGGNANCYPTWSPDSKAIVFGHGTSCKSNAELNATGSLFTMNPESGEPVELARAAAGSDALASFEPRFSPFDEGGYFWLSFLSRRDYGNASAGTKGTRRQQIWVTAIKKDAPPGEDPSAIPYWLPGQDPETINITADWAARSCRPGGSLCSVGSECCSGDCRPDKDGVLMCEPAENACRMAGQACSDTDPCCGGLMCNTTINQCVGALI